MLQRLTYSESHRLVALYFTVVTWLTRISRLICLISRLTLSEYVFLIGYFLTNPTHLTIQLDPLFEWTDLDHWSIHPSLILTFTSPKSPQNPKTTIQTHQQLLPVDLCSFSSSRPDQSPSRLLTVSSSLQFISLDPRSLSLISHLPLMISDNFWNTAI